MPENIREMEPVGVSVPDEVIENVGDVLDRPVMGREGIEEEVMPKALQNQERALDERIVVGQVLIVPDQLTLKGRKVDRESEQRQQGAARPGALTERRDFSA